MSNGDRRPLRRSAGLARRSLLAQQGVAFLLAGVLLSVLEAVVRGRLTTPAVGLLAGGGALLALGLVRALLTARGRRPDDAAGEDDGSDGDGGTGLRPEPMPPSGGIEIDWDRFERDFWAYADSLTVCGAASA